MELFHCLYCMLATTQEWMPLVTSLCQQTLTASTSSYSQLASLPGCLLVASVQLTSKMQVYTMSHTPLLFASSTVLTYSVPWCHHPSLRWAGEQSRRQSASVSSESLALFTAEENSFYVGSIVSGATPSFNVRQYGFGDRDFERSSSYIIQTSGFVRTFFGGFVNGTNAYYFVADGDPRNLRGLRVLRTCDSTSCTSTPCIFGALYELRMDCGSGTFPQGAQICGLSALDSFAGSSETTIVLARCNTGTSGRNRVCSFRLADIDSNMDRKYSQCAGGTGEIVSSWDAETERPCSSFQVYTHSM